MAEVSNRRIVFYGISCNIVIGAVLWGSDWAGKRISFHCDNSSTVYITKKGRSKSREIRSLIRRLIMCSAKYNYIVYAVHLTGGYTNIADDLSRYQMRKFLELAPQALPKPCPPHSKIVWN